MVNTKTIIQEYVEKIAAPMSDIIMHRDLGKSHKECEWKDDERNVFRGCGRIIDSLLTLAFSWKVDCAARRMREVIGEWRKGGGGEACSVRCEDAVEAIGLKYFQDQVQRKS